MPINPQLLALLAQKAGTGDVDQLATLLDKEVPGGPPTIAPPPQQPFPLPPRGGGIPQGAGAGGPGVLGVGGGGRPSPLPAAAQAAPQALAAASNQSPLGGGLAPGASGGGFGANILASLSGLIGGGAGAAAGSSAGAALPGGLPSGVPAGGGVNPLEALVPPTPGQQQQAPRAIAPRPGGQIDPRIMQLILQSLRAGGGQPQQPQQSLGSILGGLR